MYIPRTHFVIENESKSEKIWLEFLGKILNILL